MFTNTIYLDDITETLGVWLDMDIDGLVPYKCIELLEKAYKIAVEQLEVISMMDKYNKMLKAEYGENITVEIKGGFDDGNEFFYYTSARYGDSDRFETIEEAYKEASNYLHIIE